MKTLINEETDFPAIPYSVVRDLNNRQYEFVSADDNTVMLRSLTTGEDLYKSIDDMRLHWE